MQQEVMAEVEAEEVLLIEAEDLVAAALVALD